MGLGLGLCCCGGCQCLRYRDGTYLLVPHIRWDSSAHGLAIGTIRQADPTIWKGTSVLGSVLNVMGIRIPMTGKPRLLYLFNPPSSALTSSSFDALAGRPGVLFECRLNTWTLIESVNFSYAGTPIVASSAVVDGVSPIHPYSAISATGAPDEIWCNPSYIPDPIQLTFANLPDETISGVLYNRSVFNGVGISCSLVSTTTIGARTQKRYSATVYTNGTITCGGIPGRYPQGTFRWEITVFVNYPATVDGTATSMNVQIHEAVPTEIGFTGCYNFTPYREHSAARWIATFDKLDDGLGIGHWIPMYNEESVPLNSPITMPPFGEGRYYTKRAANMSGSGAAIGRLLRVTA